MKTVYLIQAENTDRYKIGITAQNVSERIKQLQTGNSYKLIEVKSFKTKHQNKLESALHRQFKSKKVEGEWFELNKEEVGDFIQFCAKIESNFNFLEKTNSYWQRNNNIKPNNEFLCFYFEKKMYVF